MRELRSFPITPGILSDGDTMTVTSQMTTFPTRTSLITAVLALTEPLAIRITADMGSLFLFNPAVLAVSMETIVIGTLGSTSIR